jgi:outer membrane protein TolC
MKDKRTRMQTVRRRATMNEEYLKAKVDLCLNQAEIDIQQEEIARAIKNLKRANNALSQLFGFEEDTNND